MLRKKTSRLVKARRFCSPRGKPAVLNEPQIIRAALRERLPRFRSDDHEGIGGDAVAARVSVERALHSLKFAELARVQQTV